MPILESTWKIAAAVLGVHEETAKRQFRESQATDKPMPIYQSVRRGRIRFDETELRAWQRASPPVYSKKK